MKDKIVFWLEQIHTALKGVSAAMVQSDWDEDDAGSAAFIKNKPEIPVIPVIPAVHIIEGTVSEGAFTAEAGQMTLAQAAEAISEGAIVYLKYTDSDNDVIEMATGYSETDSEITTRNLTWS